MKRWLRVLAGTALSLLGIAMALMPLRIAEILSRPHETSPQMINLRASWGGSVLGLGLFVAWLETLRPWSRTTLGLLVWSMTGIALARGLGFLLDGGPDVKQWVWLTLEILLAVGGALILRRRAKRQLQTL